MVSSFLQLLAEGKIYIFLYLLLYLFATLENCKEVFRYRYCLSLISALLLVLFTGLRWETGTDWEPYKELFDTLKLDWTFLLNVYSFDLGYVLFNALIRLFTDSYTVFLLIDSLVAVGIVFWFVSKYSKYPNLSFFVFYNAYFVAQFMGSNRRIVSLGLMLFYFSAIFLKNKRRQLATLLTAFLFHRSALIGIASYLIPQVRLSPTKVFLVLSISLVIGATQAPFKLIGIIANSLTAFQGNPLIEKMLYYSDFNDEQIPENVNPVVQMGLSTVKRLCFLLFYLWLITKKRGTLDPLTDFFFNIYIAGFAFYLLLNGASTFQMLTTYFTFVEVALIGRMWVYTNKKERFSFLCFLLLYGLFQLTSSVNAYPDLYMPYKFAFYK